MTAPNNVEYGDPQVALPNEILRSVVGSGVHGIAIAGTDDHDEMGVYIEPPEYLLGVERPAPSPRLRNIAEIGVRTFGWAYRNRGLPVPPIRPFINLATPFGESWTWNTPSANEAVTGDAFAFCQVVTQTRNAADTDLHIAGPTARHWMSIAQCFAGPPETPPAPGSRHRAAPETGRRA